MSCHVRGTLGQTTLHLARHPTLFCSTRAVVRRTKIRSKRTCKTVYTNKGTSWPGSPRGSLSKRKTANPARYISYTASAAGYAPSKPHRRSRHGKRVHGRIWKMPSEPMPKRAVRRCTNRNLYLAFCSCSRNNLTNAGVHMCTRQGNKSRNEVRKYENVCLPALLHVSQRPGFPCPKPGVYRRAVFPPAVRRVLCSRHVLMYIRSSYIQFGTPDADILPERKHAPWVFESRATGKLVFASF